MPMEQRSELNEVLAGRLFLAAVTFISFGMVLFAIGCLGAATK